MVVAVVLAAAAAVMVASVHEPDSCIFTSLCIVSTTSLNLLHFEVPPENIGIKLDLSTVVVCEAACCMEVRPGL